MKTKQDIHDMIQPFELDGGGHPERVTSRLLDIMQALNERVGELERQIRRQDAGSTLEGRAQ